MISDDEGLFGSVYEPGIVVFRQDEPGDTMYIIQSGAVEYSYRQGDIETVLTILEKGDFFGEMALFGEARRPATAKTIRQTRLLPLNRASLLDRMQTDPAVALHLLRGLYLRIQHADRQIQEAVENNEVLRLALAQRDSKVGAPVKTQSRPTQEKTADAMTAADISLPEMAALWDIEQEAVSFESGQRIFSQGDRAEVMYVILKGDVEISSGTETNKYVFFRYYPGDFFGESEILTGQVRASSATAITPTLLMPIDREEFASRIQARPELALFILQALSIRLQNISSVLANPKAPVDPERQRWRPLLQKQERAKIAIVSLSTCAGCSAVFLDEEVLADVLETTDIVYCPMLIDQERILEADIALIDGAVRLKEDQEKLQEARRKSRLVVAWGTCASFGGIPAHANRYELEDLIQETYGQTFDAYAYYLSGARGVDQEAYQEEGIELLRKAYELDDFVRVDYYVPGCPPTPGHLLQLLAELMGTSFEGAKAIVCAECGRRPGREAVTELKALPRQMEEGVCFHSLGALCLGFLTRGGCGAACTRNMLPCWGCRGPANVAQKTMATGDSFEEVVIGRLVRRCRMEEEQLKPAVKLLRQQGHGLFDFDRNFLSSLSRVR